MRTISIVCVVAMLAAAGTALAQTGSGEITLVSARPLEAGEDFAGNWEYVYDLNITDLDYLSEHGLSGFDTSQILNQWEYDPYQYETAPQGTLVQYWTWWAAHDVGTIECFGSYSTDQLTWTLHNEPWSMDNTWHDPDDYTGGSGILKAPSWFTGLVDEDNDSLAYTARRLTGTNLTGMVMTFRIVHPNAPGTIDWWVSNRGGSASDAPTYTDIGTVIGPAGTISPVGDFDNDFDIDADDVDLLLANLGGDPEVFDLTGDGVVNQADVDDWVFNLVPIGENIGTVYGDFNLDGEVNAGDLALLATNYGLAGNWGWATGDGNGDGNVDAGDLAMLATNYGTVVHPVSEPVTMSLLAVGSVALLKRRK
jgi:hypothetical protein